MYTSRIALKLREHDFFFLLEISVIKKKKATCLLWSSKCKLSLLLPLLYQQLVLVLCFYKVLETWFWTNQHAYFYVFWAYILKAPWKAAYGRSLPTGDVRFYRFSRISSKNCLVVMLCILDLVTLCESCLDESSNSQNMNYPKMNKNLNLHLLFSSGCNVLFFVCRKTNNKADIWW